MEPVVVFDHVSKKFRRGQNHDNLRDLIPSLVRGVWRRSPAEALGAREFWALRDVSFEVRPGEALGIIGANGAGKSTSLKLLTRILRPTMGRAAIHGRVGALIEIAAGFHPELTGRENVYLQGAIMGMRRPEIAARFDEIVDFAAVSAFIDTPVKRYSSGMKARLGFSVAAHLQPVALVIDEVLSVGDLPFQRKCFDRMMEFRDQGVAIVLVSHNLQAVASLCQTSICLAGGAVQAAGPTVEVLDAYVQAVNRIETADRESPVEVTSTALLSAGQPVDPQSRLAPGTPMTLRVRARTREPLDDVTFGFLVYRSTDQLMLYHGQAHRQHLGADPLTGDFTVDLQFRPHLVRGHYYIVLELLHNPTHVYLIPRRQAATLIIHETASREGIADFDFAISRPDRDDRARR